MYSAALAEGRWSLLAMSEREMREYDTEIFLRPVGRGGKYKKRGGKRNEMVREMRWQKKCDGKRR